MKWTKRRIFSAIWVTLGLSFTAWMAWSFQTHGVNDDALRSNHAVTMRETADTIEFTPEKPSANVLIFFPGAMVAPKAYAPLCQKLAAAGCPTIIIKMPWRQATRGYNKPKELNLLSDTTKTYILAGHSQGAKMAAQFVHENPGLIDKLILIGTTHPRDIDLSQNKISALKIVGSNDGVATVKDSNTNKLKLPSATKYVVIDGANHSQFGYYGFQLGDNSPTITREQQQQIVLENILAFISTP